MEIYWKCTRRSDAAYSVMAGYFSLSPATTSSLPEPHKTGVDARDKPGHDDGSEGRISDSVIRRMDVQQNWWITPR